MRILGVTATPMRGDKKALGDIFQTVSFEMGLMASIQEGWLVDIEQKLVVVEGLDFSKCRTTAGDLNDKDLASAMMGGVTEKIAVSADEMTPLQREQIEQQEKMLHAVVDPTIKESQGRPTLVFCVTKSHAERMCEIFNRYPGINAEFVTDDTPKEDRKSIINRFKAGQLQIICNVGILLEGFDSRVDVIAMARPTKSLSLYIQCIGRGTRPLPNLVDNIPTAAERREAIALSAKPCTTILDFVGNSGEHNLCQVVDALGGEYEECVIAAAKRKLASGDTEIVTELLAKTRDEIEESKKRAALEKAERERLAKELAEQERERRRQEAAKRDKIRAEVQYRTESVKLIGAVVPAQVGVGQFRGGATDGQIKFLIRLGVSEQKACSYTKGQAGAVIDKLSNATGPDFRVRFGKYAGNRLGDLPSSYLDWASKNLNDADFQRNLKQMRGA